MNGESSTSLSKADAEKLLDGIVDNSDRLLIAIGLNTGIKISEIYQIASPTINYPKKTLVIWDNEKQRHRNVILTNKLLDLLKSFEINRFETDAHFFPYTTQTIHNRIVQYSTTILGKQKNWQSLRRTYVVLSAKSNIPFPIVVENTGEPASVVFEYYVHEPIDFKVFFDGKELMLINQKKLL